MKYGMPSLIELPALEDNAKLCRELELDFVELNMNFYPYQPHFLERSGLRKLGQRYGIGFTIHLDENMNMADFNPKVAKAYRETAGESIGLAAWE